MIPVLHKHTRRVVMRAVWLSQRELGIFLVSVEYVGFQALGKDCGYA